MLTVVFCARSGTCARCHYTGQTAELLDICNINNTQIKQIDLWAMNDSLHSWNVLNRGGILLILLGDTCRCNKVYFFDYIKQCSISAKQNQGILEWNRLGADIGISLVNGKWTPWQRVHSAAMLANRSQQWSFLQLKFPTATDHWYYLQISVNMRWQQNGLVSLLLSKETHFRSSMAVNIYYTRCHLMWGIKKLKNGALTAFQSLFCSVKLSCCCLI